MAAIEEAGSNYAFETSLVDTVRTGMSILDRLSQFLRGESDIFDSFERALIERLADALAPNDAVVFRDQVCRFNRVRRDPDDGTVRSVETYMYWKEWGKIRRDFPLRFATGPGEWKLATMLVDCSVGQIAVEFWLVDGALFSMKFTAASTELRPLNPYFTIGSIEINSINPSAAQASSN